MVSMTIRIKDEDKQRLDAIKQQAQRLHRVELSMQQVLLMVLLCGMDHLEQAASNDD